MECRDWTKCQAIQEELDALKSEHTLHTPRDSLEGTKSMNGRGVLRGVGTPKPVAAKPSWGDWRDKEGKDGVKEVKSRRKPKIKREARRATVTYSTQAISVTEIQKLHVAEHT